MNNLSPETIQHAGAYAATGAGTVQGNEINVKTNLQTGSNEQGGKVACIVQPLDPGYIHGETHGIIAATTDYDLAPWGCYGISIKGSAGALPVAGPQNTAAIIQDCQTAGIAAGKCSDHLMNGYGDW